MSTRKKIRFVLLSAARQTKELAAYLVSFPDDYTVIASLREEADAITRIAQTLRLKELVHLANRLVDAAAGDLSSADRIRELDDIVSQILVIAQTLAPNTPEQESAPQQSNIEVPADPFSGMGGTRWVRL